MPYATGEPTRTEGKQCRRCEQTEARCAFNYGKCCDGCTHWTAWTADGEPIATTGAAGGRPIVQCDQVTAKRREQWRRQYAARRAS